MSRPRTILPLPTTIPFFDHISPSPNTTNPLTLHPPCVSFRTIPFTLSPTTLQQHSLRYNPWTNLPFLSTSVNLILHQHRLSLPFPLVYTNRTTSPTLYTPGVCTLSTLDTSSASYTLLRFQDSFHFVYPTRGLLNSTVPTSTLPYSHTLSLDSSTITTTFEAPHTLRALDYLQWL